MTLPLQVASSFPESMGLDLYRDMLRIRMIEEAIADRYKEQKMRCPVHLSIGQEAVAVGVCKAALQSDYLISGHRAHAHYLAKGGNFRAMLAEIYGKEAGCCQGRGGSMHLIDRSVGMYGSTPIVGGSLPIAVGLAFATAMKRDPHVTIVFFGEGSTEEGVFGECLNFAALKRLPILFVCENNFYSVYSPLSVRQPKERDRIAIARAHGVAVEAGYGNDVEEVFEISGRTIQAIRDGSGPVFLEFETYRFREHCGPNFDNDIGYRTPEEAAFWEKKCPLLHQQRRHRIDDRSMRASIADEIENAFQFAEASPFPVYDPEAENPYA